MRRREWWAVLVPLAGVVVLSGCGPRASDVRDGDAAPSAPTSTGVASDPVPSGTSPTPQPSAAAPSTSSTTSATAGQTPSGGATGAPTTGSRARTASVAGGWPKALGEPQHGELVWAVYLAVGHSATDAAVELAVRQAAGVGYHAVVGDVACDEGALAALRLDEYDFWSAATLYFAREGDARAFARSYATRVRAPRGVARVNVGCLD